jgi:DNA-binding transcriptional ArsR family regulator
VKGDASRHLDAAPPPEGFRERERERAPVWDTRGRKFLRGPLSIEWLARAADLGGAALAVGLECWYRAGLARSAAFRLNLSRLAVAPALARSSARRGLRRLEQAGLVSVARPAGQRVLVSLKVPERDRVESGGDS